MNGTAALRIFPTVDSPNLVGGSVYNTIATIVPAIYGATIAGGGSYYDVNRVGRTFGTVGGGGANHADGYGSTIAGGFNGQATSDYATVAGGLTNHATGNASGIGGGQNNVASGTPSHVGGGDGHISSQSWATVGGGASNQVNGGGAAGTIGGGMQNIASGDVATIAGGQVNHATGDGSSMGGGTFNTASARSATGGVYFATAIDGTGGLIAGVQLPAGGNAWGALSDRNSKANFVPVNARSVVEKLAQIPDLLTYPPPHM